MCYDVKSGLRALIKYAKHRNDDPAYLAKLEAELKTWSKEPTVHYHASGFAHPKLLVFTNDKPLELQFFSWGLIPSWVKDRQTANTIQNQTLNARAETIFEKPSFRESAKHKRCLIYVDAFYERHHYKGKTYPFHISMRDGSPMIFAGLWDVWLDKETGELAQTVSIVTTKGNNLLAKIHNNPKLEESRMPVILSAENKDDWLKPFQTKEDETYLKSLLVPCEEALLEAYTVNRLRGKQSFGNCIESTQLFLYSELSFIF